MDKISLKTCVTHKIFSKENLFNTQFLNEGLWKFAANFLITLLIDSDCQQMKPHTTNSHTIDSNFASNKYN